MKLQRITFLGVRGLADASFDLTNPDTGEPHDVVVITGPAASGKTRALEAIAAAKEAIGPYGPQQPGGPWIREGAVAKVALAFHLDDEERTYAGSEIATMDGEAGFFPDAAKGESDEGLAALLERYDHRSNHGKLEYFPATRRIPIHAPFHGTGPFEQRPLRSGKDPRKYSFIPRFLQDLEDRPNEAHAFTERLAALSTTCKWERGGSGKGLPRSFRSRGGAPISVAELADSEANAVIFAATAVAIQLARSIVLVDRPELHVDPAELPRFVAGLAALGAGNQIVLASSSPAVLAAAPGAAVLQLAAAAG